jgi:alpha-glucosidase
LNLDFLDEGIYNATICEDGLNADRSASDYRITERPVSKETNLSLDLAPGGGYLIRIRLLNK